MEALNLLKALPAVAREPVVQLTIGAVFFFGLVTFYVVAYYLKPSATVGPLATVKAYTRFAWSCFFKPHTGDDSGSQQDALESFYKHQADAYDATRKRLLHGREDMLNLVASQLKQKNFRSRKPIWVDIGGGTGWNIEQMNRFIPVTQVFKSVYLVDFSPSLCNVARSRFQRLGWKNVTVICQDARHFKLEDYEDEVENSVAEPEKNYDTADQPRVAADVITLSYALSMIPEFYPVVDALSLLLSTDGIIGVVDFYVQSQVDFKNRNYTGGAVDRHCTWLSRTFWRTWFEIDRVNLEGARRDYLEYRFGTKLSTNQRNHFFGVRIPYYIWIGCPKNTPAMEAKLAEMDAAAIESPFLAALDSPSKLNVQESVLSTEGRSKAYECAVVNLSAKLPLPCFWYQNHHWRIYYDWHLKKYTQFKDQYIYAFAWEDTRVDARVLNVNNDDVILALTSAGCNILSLAIERPKRIHAVDLNPAQNHLLELKLAALTNLDYEQVWKLFGEGRHDQFRDVLISKLSPHLSSYAFQYWLHNGPKIFGETGLYYTGGSGIALRLAGRLFKIFGLSEQVKRMCTAQTLAGQKEIWDNHLRGVLLNRLLSWTVMSNEKWLWKALGVPANQRNIILRDWADVCDATGKPNRSSFGRAIWEYLVNTLEPVVSHTLLSNDNHYYLLCLQGQYSRTSHPDYLGQSAFNKLSAGNAFDGLRIHTDELMEVIARLTPSSLTIAIVMDSMDWFDPASDAAEKQVRALNRALKLQGRVLLRSAGLEPWYLKTFEKNGFETTCMGRRNAGLCIDRVNMYASCWICTKTRDIMGRARVPSLTI